MLGVEPVDSCEFDPPVRHSGRGQCTCAYPSRTSSTSPAFRLGWITEHLFSNTLPPALVCASLAGLALLSTSTARRDRLEANTRWFRGALTEAGFAIRPGSHPIVPIMLGDAHLAHRMAADLLDEGIYVVGFSYPVVPEGQARIRVQISAAHELPHLERAVAAFVKVGRVHGVLR